VARGGKIRRVQTPKMPARDVAAAGYEKFRAGKAVTVPGISNRLLIFAPRIIPRAFARRLVKKYNSSED